MTVKITTENCDNAMIAMMLTSAVINKQPLPVGLLDSLNIKDLNKLWKQINPLLTLDEIIWLKSELRENIL